PPPLPPLRPGEPPSAPPPPARSSPSAPCPSKSSALPELRRPLLEEGADPFDGVARAHELAQVERLDGVEGAAHACREVGAGDLQRELERRAREREVVRLDPVQRGGDRLVRDLV